MTVAAIASVSQPKAATGWPAQIRLLAFHHDLSIDHAEAMRFSAQENILGNGSQIYELDLLVEGDNASRLRLGRVLECHIFLVVLYNTSISSISPRHNFDIKKSSVWWRLAASDLMLFVSAIRHEPMFSVCENPIIFFVFSRTQPDSEKAVAIITR
jgi:hypothetical protein